MPLAHADKLTLRVPIIENAPDSHRFSHDLLLRALRQQGHTVALDTVAVPQSRAHMMLERGEIGLIAMVRSQQRDENFLPVPVGLTNGLVGKRVLLINPDQQFLFDGVDSLEEFRARQLVAGMGSGWFDVNVWKHNDLVVKEHSGNWQAIYRM